MEYGNNILKIDAAYYELKNAAISNGILTIGTNGSVKCTITDEYIVRATEYFMVNLVTETPTDRYVPRTQVNIHYVTKDELNTYNYALFPTEFSTGIYSEELQLKAGEYKEFTFEIKSKDKISFLLWELCPEAADEDLQTIIEGVEQSLPKLLYDYNTWPLTVDQDEKTIALITFRLLSHTDLQGHFQLTYVASEACTLTLRFKDNEATELFSPLLYDLHAGRGSVGIPHAYLDRLPGIHSLIVTAQVTSGSLVVDTRGILFTIDGGYLAERMLDIGADVRDISIRQLAQDYGPDEIWIIGIEAGEAIVRKRKYDPKATIGFEPQFSLGQAKDAAIEFDGDWVLRPDNINYTIETYEDPWVFWIDKNDNLLAQIGNDEATRVILDTGVSGVHTCRGYKSQFYVEQDQGIICVYIKNEKAYYIQYKYNVTSGTYRWDTVEEVDSSLSGVTYVSVGRLNDYRVQITVKHASGVKTYISDRTYVNQAVPPEVINGPSLYQNACMYCPANYDTSVNVINTFKSDDLLTLSFTVDRILKVHAYDVKEIFTYNSSIPEYEPESGKPYVKDISYSTDINAKTTTFTINLNFAPTQLITEVYLNAAKTLDVIAVMDEYGTIVCPTLTIQYDITRLLKAALQTETINNTLTVNKASLRYKGIQVMHHSEAEHIQESISVNNASLHFKSINVIHSSTTEVLSGIGVNSAKMTYKKVTDQPI